MQQIFPCPVCGAQNYIGQAHCQVCGQRFQYNCPYCGAVVDSTLVNCPGCRQGLFWPTPQRVKPFAKQPAAYRQALPPAQAEITEEQPKKKSKSDPWLTGCLGLIIIAIILLAAYFVYDNYIKEKSTPTLPVSATPNWSQSI